MNASAQHEHPVVVPNPLVTTDPRCIFEDPITKKQYFAVEKILDSRQSVVKGHLVIEYLVEWLNYPDSENTWEPEENLQGAPDRLQEFYNQNFVKN